MPDGTAAQQVNKLLPTAVAVEVCDGLVFDMCFVCLCTGMFAAGLADT